MAIATSLRQARANGGTFFFTAFHAIAKLSDDVVASREARPARPAIVGEVFGFGVRFVRGEVRGRGRAKFHLSRTGFVSGDALAAGCDLHSWLAAKREGEKGYGLAGAAPSRCCLRQKGTGEVPPEPLMFCERRRVSGRL